jgi:tungstate transport system substrate-binding protein
VPSFERQCGCRVDVIAAGTGQALEIARRGDADVVLVHNRQAEERFLAEGHARRRFDVMYNDFIVAGPAADPAGTAAMTRARDAFAAIARSASPFASRGDQSGTHMAELAIWAALGIRPMGAAWYSSIGQGMGETLLFADERDAYVLADRATYLAMRAKLPHLRLLVGGARLEDNKDPSLLNRYGVMAVNGDRHPGVVETVATKFVEWLLSPATQTTIGKFGAARFGQPLFYPDSDAYKAARGRGR